MVNIETPMPIVTRQIEDRDIEAFYAGLCVVIAEGLYLGFETPPHIEGTRTFVRGNIANRYPQIVAFDDETFAGWCDVTPGGRSTTRHDGALGMALMPAYRGRGLGERLLREAIEASWAWGMTRISLHVFTENTRAYGLYRKFGFVEEGRHRGRLKFGSVYRDDISMGLRRPDAT
jgi:ribosomal protein S18 acetylase RimI-like enzyme